VLTGQPVSAATGTRRRIPVSEAGAPVVGQAPSSVRNSSANIGSAKRYPWATSDAQGTEAGEVLGRLHALRDHRQSQMVPDVDHRPEHEAVGAVVAGQEPSVELHLVER